MFDNLLTNKYFCIAVLIALIIILYLYSQKKSCDVEGMQNIDLTPQAQELSQPPWTNRKEGGDHRTYNNKFDKFADWYTEKKLKKNGFSFTDYLKRDDQRYLEYARGEGDRGLAQWDGRQGRGPRRDYDGYAQDGLPRPMDSLPQINGYQSCEYPGDKLMSSDGDSDDTEAEEKIKRKMAKMAHKLKKMKTGKKKLNY